MSTSRPGLREVVIVWFFWAIATALLFITNARIAPAELYNVSHAGLAGGASRALVQFNFPVALAAVAIAAILVAQIRQNSGVFAPQFRRLATVALVAGVVLCAIVAVPGVVSQDNLDARWINVPAAIGVLILAGTTLAIVRTSGSGQNAPFASDDRFRIAIAVLLGLVALPWLFADAGFYIGRIPALGSIFLSEQIRPGETEAAVHLGHHHGADGFYLAVTALFLSRVAPRIDASKLRAALGFYLALMLAYGIGNMVNDGWTEQVWKRGWTARTAPSVLVPALTLAWGSLVLAAAAIYFFVFRRLTSVPNRPKEARR